MSITIGDNFSTPILDNRTTSEIFQIVKTEDFDPVMLNSLLGAVIVYLESHGVCTDDIELPWAEEMVEQ